MISVRSYFHSDSNRFVSFNNTKYFVLCSPIGRQVSLPLRHNEVLQSIAAGIWISYFLLAFFIVCSNSSSSGSMKEIPRNCLAISSLGYSIAHFCFAFRFDASDTSFHISGQTLSLLEVVCFLVSLTGTMYIRQVAVR